jgi:site-specific DNA-cytosine methylase
MTWHTLLAIDLDKWATRVYRANFPDTETRCASVADEIDRLPECDVITAGFPCQPHSLGGQRRASADSRDCGPDFVAAIRKRQPRMFLGENVPGLLSSEGGRYLDRLLRSMDEADYEVRYRLLDAVRFGCPQFRNRLWVWGIRKDLYADGIRHCWPTPTHVWPPPQPCMFGSAPLPGITVEQALGLEGWYDAQNDKKHGPDEPCGTIQGNAQGRGGRAGHYAIRKPRSAKVIRRDHPVDEPCPTIESRAAMGGGSAMRMVCRVMGGGRNHTNKNPDGTWRRDERDITAEPSTTIPCTGFALQGGVIPRVHLYRWSDAMLTKHPPASPASPIQAKYFKGGAEGLLEWKRSKDGLWVRRLTPWECSRLQSVPDDFVWPEDLPKTHAYRVVGNGWASVMGKVFADAFAAADPDSRTVVSLFCGGGLGDCGWHGRHWSYEAIKLAAKGGSA